jgi:hypothetical protein
MTEKRRVIKARKRPDLRPRPKEGTLFHDAGPTGWGRPRRDVSKPEGVSEHNFADQHDKFTTEGGEA